MPYGQATPEWEQKRCHSIGFLYYPVYLPHQTKVILPSMSLTIRNRILFTTIPWVKSLSLFLWFGWTISSKWCWFDFQSQQPNMTLGIILCTKEKSTGNGFKTHWPTESSKVQNIGYQLPHKMDLSPTKTF